MNKPVLQLDVSCEKCGHGFEVAVTDARTIKDWAEELICPNCESGYEWLRFTGETTK